MRPTFRRSHFAHSCLGSALLLALAIAAAAGRVVDAQAPAQNACGLLTTDEVQMLTLLKVSAGVASAAQGLDSFTCRYTWGTGIERMTLAVAVNPASRVFAGMSADGIKQALLSPVVPGTADGAIPDIGAAAAFKAYSSVYVSAAAYVKDRILQVQLDGVDASAEKAQLVALLKAAASRM